MATIGRQQQSVAVVLLMEVWVLLVLVMVEVEAGYLRRVSYINYTHMITCSREIRTNCMSRLPMTRDDTWVCMDLNCQT